MKNELQEQDVTRLLERIKERETSYPPEMQQKRREAFLALGAIGLSGAGLGETAGGVAQTATAPMTIGMKVTLGILSTMIVALSTYLGVALYENRDALRDLLQGGSPTAVLVSPPPSVKTADATPDFLATGTPNQTATPTITPMPTLPGGENGYPVTATKPGWHYGQTKTPRPKNFK